MGEANKSTPADARRIAKPHLDKVRPVSRALGRKLPWLDNKSCQPSSSLPLDGQGSGTDTPSPGTRPQSRIASLAPPPQQTHTGTPSNQKRRQAAVNNHGIPSTADASPSPVTSHRLSQARRASQVIHTLPSFATRHHASFSHESLARHPNTRLNGIDEKPHGSLVAVRSRTSSLVPVPDHLEESSTLESGTEYSGEGEVVKTPVPAVSTVQMSPRQPAPGHDTFERLRSRKLSNAVEDLEIMVHEAVDLAGVSADQGRVQEIYEIIDEARSAIHDASGDQMNRMVSDITSHEVSDSSRDGEETPSTDQINPTYITPLRKHPPPMTNGQNFISDQHHSLPKDPAAVDWASSRRRRDGNSSFQSSSKSSDTQDDSRFSTGTDLLLPPHPTQAAPRSHVDFVLRPIATDESRGRSHHRVRRRHRRSYDTGSWSRPGSRRQRDRLSDLTENDTSLEEPLQRRPYGNNLTLREARHHTFHLRRHHERQPIARNWTTHKKRLTATIACINTALLGVMIGVYAGEVPRIQYYLADERHIVVVGNVVLYFGLAISTFVGWTLPLLHGRKPYVLAALAITLPLQFPQAVVVGSARSPNNARFRTGLLCARAVSGLVLGFANVNHITVLLDLFGASLQSKNPHQELVVANDVRRHGGGMGLWLGLWSWCWIGSLAVGFQVGAAIIESLSPDWGFYIVVIILAFALILNIMSPETRRAQYRKSITEVYDRDQNYITRRVSQGEVKLHMCSEGPKYWFEEVWAGMKLMLMMFRQPGFLVVAVYLGWIYAQIVLVIILLGALLSRDYQWKPRYVGAGVMSIAIGGVLAIPLTKAGLFSRERKSAFRTDSMTFQKQVTWSSHLVRRVIFTLALPLMGLAYTVSSAGRPKPYMVPIVFAGAVGFLSVLAIAECHGLIMETFDTCDLQPGVNTRHRLQSMAVQDRRRRTNYTSFPRVSAGIFASHTVAFIGAAVATEVGGSMTRHLGAQASTGVTAGILLGLTLLLTAVLWRFKEVQVIPNHTFGTRRDTAAWQDFKELEKMGRGKDWKPVVIGNPSGRMRRVSMLELGSLSRWTEIRKLNFLLKSPRADENKPKRRSFRDSW